MTRTMISCIVVGSNMIIRRCRRRWTGEREGIGIIGEGLLYVLGMGEREAEGGGEGWVYREGGGGVVVI